VEGELLAVLVIVTVPDEAPPVAGAKVALKVTTCPAASVYGNVGPLMLYPAPLAVAFEIFTLPVPVFVTETIWRLLFPTLTFP